MEHAPDCPMKKGADGCECAEHRARKLEQAAPLDVLTRSRVCTTLDCKGCGGVECPYKRPTSLAEAQHTEKLGGSPSCLTWPPRPPIL